MLSMKLSTGMLLTVILCFLLLIAQILTRDSLLDLLSYLNTVVGWLAACMSQKELEDLREQNAEFN